MCYEYSHWFSKTRARELQKAREKTDAARRTPVDTPAAQPQRAPAEVKEKEKIPA